MTHKIPQTREEWQEVVNMAEFLLLFDSAKMYGLVEGGPEIKREKCAEMVARGRLRGIVPAHRDVLIGRYLTGTP